MNHIQNALGSELRQGARLDAELRGDGFHDLGSLDWHLKVTSPLAELLGPHGVYVIRTDFEVLYVGQTGRPLSERLREHKNGSDWARRLPERGVSVWFKRSGPGCGRLNADEKLTARKYNPRYGARHPDPSQLDLARAAFEPDPASIWDSIKDELSSTVRSGR